MVYFPMRLRTPAQSVHRDYLPRGLYSGYERAYYHCS
jgi:hypothetical protein